MPTIKSQESHPEVIAPGRKHSCILSNPIQPIGSALMDRIAFWPFPKPFHNMNGNGSIEMRNPDSDP